MAINRAHRLRKQNMRHGLNSLTMSNSSPDFNAAEAIVYLEENRTKLAQDGAAFYAELRARARPLPNHS